MAKEIISESRLREIISEEAARFKKKLTLEAEKKKLLKRLNEMYMEEVSEEDTLEEVNLDKLAHQEAIDFLATHPKSEVVKSLYKAYKEGDSSAGKKLIPWVLNYAEKELNKNKDAASDFLKDLTRVMDDDISREVKSQRSGSI